MSNNRLVECEYCRGLREYKAGKSCPGCGATLRPPKESRKLPQGGNPQADWQRQMMGMQSMRQRQMMNQAGMTQGQYMGPYGGYPHNLFGSGKGGW